VQIICRMFQLPAAAASELQTNALPLADAIESAGNHSDVYRYWHTIEYLLTQHAPAAPTARWLELGTTVSGAASADEIPAPRLIPANEIAELDRLLQGIEPEHLIPHYDAAAMDAAAIHPRTWQEWEETFDPLGQVLEHYSFLRFAARRCAEAGDSLLLVFEELADGSV
jgi:hypothetical protein